MKNTCDYCDRPATYWFTFYFHPKVAFAFCAEHMRYVQVVTC